MKRDLKLPHYQRYMDDLTFFGDSAAVLERARDAAVRWLWDERRLRLKVPGAEPRSSKGSFTYLGYRVSRAGVRPTREVLRRMQRRVAEVVLLGDRQRVERSVASYLGVLDFVGSRRC